MSVFGALDYGSGALTTMVVPAASAEAFAAFLDEVAARWPADQLVLVLDNASYHKTGVLRVWFADHADRVGVLWLPTYSPQLNLIERVWRFVKGALACHRFWNDLPSLVARAEAIMDATSACFAAPTRPHIQLRQDLCKSA